MYELLISKLKRPEHFCGKAPYLNNDRKKFVGILFNFMTGKVVLRRCGWSRGPFALMRNKQV